MREERGREPIVLWTLQSWDDGEDEAEHKQAEAVLDSAVICKYCKPNARQLDSIVSPSSLRPSQTRSSARVFSCESWRRISRSWRSIMVFVCTVWMVFPSRVSKCNEGFRWQIIGVGWSRMRLFYLFCYSLALRTSTLVDGFSFCRLTMKADPTGVYDETLPKTRKSCLLGSPVYLNEEYWTFCKVPYK